MTGGLTLSPTLAKRYLVDHGLLDRSQEGVVEELGGGISGVVMKITTPEGCWVLKQSLPRLRVPSEWTFDQTRTTVERNCMEYLGRILPAGSVPEVVLFDEANHILGMTCAPEGGVLWKDALMVGDIDQLAARRVGELLSAVHHGAAASDDARACFWDQTVLIQGRVTPFHMAAAAAHPDLAEQIYREIDRLLATRMTLVLGDYSPKNLLVYPGYIFALDFEVAHWGDPAFDVAFCISHLVLKSCRFPERAPQYLDAARAFWVAYGRRSGSDARLEQACVAELAIMLLARVDGQSRVEYIEDEITREHVRGLARRLLSGASCEVESALAEVAMDIASWAVQA